MSAEIRISRIQQDVLDEAIIEWTRSKDAAEDAGLESAQ